MNAVHEEARDRGIYTVISCSVLIKQRLSWTRGATMLFAGRTHNANDRQWQKVSRTTNLKKRLTSNEGKGQYQPRYKMGPGPPY